MARPPSIDRAEEPRQTGLPSITPASRPRKSFWPVWALLGAAGLGALALMDQDDETPRTATPVPVPSTAPAAAPVRTVPAYVDEFHIAGAALNLYADDLQTRVARLAQDSCVMRFTISPDTLKGNWLKVTAMDDTGFNKSGFISLSALRPAPETMSEGACKAIFQP